METELVEEFFRAVAFNAGITLHVKALYGSNTHHIIEAMFKAFGRALDDATRKMTELKGLCQLKECCKQILLKLKLLMSIL